IHCRFHRWIVAIVTMTEKRHEVAVVAAQRRSWRPIPLRSRDDRLVVVEATEPRFVVALYERGVRRAPVATGLRVAEQVEGEATERIAPPHGVGTRRVNWNSESREQRGRFANPVAIVGCEHGSLAN